MGIQTVRYAKNQQGTLFQEIISWEEAEASEKTIDGSILGFDGKFFRWGSVANYLGVMPQINEDKTIAEDFVPSINPQDVREGLTLIDESEFLSLISLK